MILNLLFPLLCYPYFITKIGSMVKKPTASGVGLLSFPILT